MKKEPDQEPAPRDGRLPPAAGVALERRLADGVFGWSDGDVVVNDGGMVSARENRRLRVRA